MALLFAILLILNFGGFTGHVVGFFLTILIITLDWIDGVVARLLKETSEFSGVFDIVVDRIVENSIWIYFTSKGIISFWVPVIVLTRGFLIDGIRSVALAKGMTAFGEKTLQKSTIGKVLVNSHMSRGLYGVSKVLSFLSLIVLQALSFPEAESFISSLWRSKIVFVTYTLVYITVAFCILRGIPVFYDSWKFIFSRNLSHES
jgi:CDP-diacylglycerol--glycerol-3-phosphate 3-phosphatidyltransferase